ncbi:MAG: dinitrogenase iron-molybdenum cofactor biosynthesis protein [Desulfobulbaceae bacterium]|nr:dinitrogenase iron-molybdenum cofactor biosynthesis protein [Desulfobulbaceae bacterium]
MRIAVPTNNPGGLEAARSDHFGHCDVFTIVELDEKKAIIDVSVIVNGEHQAGGCMVPVKVLSEAEVDVIIVGGMGARPMQGFAGEGIAVYFADRNLVATAQDAVAKFSAGDLPIMHANQVCKGAGNCSH